jgi:dihydrofolate reductase
MGKLSAFNFITLNGNFKGPGEDTSWHKHDEEGSKFSEENMRPGNILLFGRKTYQMMAGFWPSPIANENFPKVAEGMNNAEKIVFSRTLQKADWQNTRIIKGDIIGEIKNLKQQGKNMTILGSGSIVSLFAKHGLLDEYMVMIDPIAIAGGTSIFKDIDHNINLKLKSTRTFKSGSVVLGYEVLK